MCANVLLTWMEDTTLKRRTKLRIASQEIEEDKNLKNIRFQKSDNDIKEEFIELEAFDESPTEINKPSKRCRRARFDGAVSCWKRKIRTFYVGQVVSVSKDYLEIKLSKSYLRFTFSWSSEIGVINRNDILNRIEKKTVVT